MLRLTELPGLRALKNYRKGFGLEAFRPRRAEPCTRARKEKGRLNRPYSLFPSGCLQRISYDRRRFPRGIRHAVWLYLRFT
jgi:hypothetical protein